MIPGSDEYDRCTECGKPVCYPTLLVLNELDIEIWTDGKVDDDSLPDLYRAQRSTPNKSTHLQPARSLFQAETISAARTVGREPVQYVRNIFKYYVAYALVRDRLLGSSET